MNINHETTHLAKKLPAYKSEVVVSLLEILVNHNHRREANREVVEGIQTHQLRHHAVSQSGLAGKGNVVGAVGHIEASEEILVFGGDRVPVVVVLEILQVSLDHGVHVAHLRHEVVLALDYLIENLIQVGGCRSRR